MLRTILALLLLATPCWSQFGARISNQTPAASDIADLTASGVTDGYYLRVESEGLTAVTTPAGGGGGGTSWVDVGETLTIGPAVGDWPDCTSGGADDKTDPGAITDFSGLTGWTSSHRWVLVKFTDVQPTSGSPTVAVTYNGDANAADWTTGTPVHAGTIGAMSLWHSAVRDFMVSIPMDNTGKAHVWCGAADVLQGTPVLTVVAFY